MIEPLTIWNHDTELKRSGRKEVWLTFMIQIIIYFFIMAAVMKPKMGTVGISFFIGMGIIFYIWDLKLIVFRLHDINAYNMLMIIAVIPFFTSLMLFVLGIIPSYTADNKWGEYTIWQYSWETVCDAFEAFLGAILGIMITSVGVIFLLGKILLL